MANKLSRGEALEILGLDEGATEKEIKMQFKKLALRWHPDKNPDDPVAAELKFQKLSAAYSHLKDEDDGSGHAYDAVSLAELLIELFGGRYFRYEPPMFCSCGRDCFGTSDWRETKRVPNKPQPSFFGYNPHSKVIGDHLVKQYADKLYNNFNQPSRAFKKDNFSKSRISQEEATHNAEELLEAEEKAKRDQQKKRERNKKKKEAKKKRKAKESVKPTARVDTCDEHHTGSPEPEQGTESQEEDSGTEFDVTSAFYARANKKTPSSKLKTPPEDSSLSNNATVSSASLQSSEGSQSQSSNPTPDPEKTEIDLAQSRKLASLGNKAAKDGNFEEAVGRYSEAIALYPFDHRYFGNRSFCFDFLEDYKSALEDANRAIKLDSTWAKGYYRQGKAYAGLKKLDLAECSLLAAVKYDSSYKEAREELHRIRVDQLINMGFPQDLCEPAIKEFGTVQASIDAILAGKVTRGATIADEPLEMPPSVKQGTHYNSKQRQKLPPRMRAMASQPSQLKHERASFQDDKRVLWVGNIINDRVTEDMLAELFQKCGEVASVRILSDRRCAFINYKKQSSSSQALKQLQGYQLEGCHLLLRYAETSGKNSYMSDARKSGVVNGTECYYWRTTGCHYGIKCHYDHIPDNKGIDFPAMMKS